MKLRTSTLLLATSLLSGCAVMNESECLTADWNAIGFEDGAYGRDLSHVGARRSACAEHGVTVDNDAYVAGYDRGVRRFCTPQRGYELGKSGKQLASHCPTELREQMREAYDEGARYYELSQDIATLQQRVGTERNRIERIRSDIRGKEQEIISDETSEAMRRTLMRDVERLKRQLDDHRDNIAGLERRIARAEREMERIDNTRF